MGAIIDKGNFDWHEDREAAIKDAFCRFSNYSGDITVYAKLTLIGWIRHKLGIAKPVGKQAHRLIINPGKLLKSLIVRFTG